MKYAFLRFVLFLISALYHGQSLTVQVFDSIRNVPLSEATVYCVEYDQTVLTNANGQSVFPLNENSNLTFKVIALGYRSAFFTVLQGQNFVQVRALPV